MNPVRILRPAACAGLLAAGLAAAQRPTFDALLDRFDRDRDGGVTRGEFGGPAERFDRMDRNQDGRVTRDEFDGAAPGRGRPATQPAPQEERNAGGGSMDDPGGPINAKRANVIDAMQARVEASGVQVGQRMPDLVVQALDGTETRLSRLWTDRPLVLVTASITCPVAVRMCPTLDTLRQAHAGRARVAIVYVNEAHPSPDGRPAAETPDASVIPTGHGAYREPTSFEERLALARMFLRQQNTEVDLLVAGMDGAFQQATGAGPNSGLLIDTGGIVRLKQGWYSPATMQAALRALESPAPARAAAGETRALPDLMFGLIADIQYADKPDGGRGGVRKFRSSKERLEQCVGDMNARGVAFVAQLGDIVDSDRNYPGPQRPDLEAAMRRDLATILAVAGGLKMPLVHVIGNHDIDVGKDALLNQLGMKRGYDAFTHTAARGWRFVVTDGTDSRRTIGPAQADWLRATLAESARKGERVICFNHYTLVQEAAPNHDRLRNDAEILAILEEAGNVAAWFSGHDHGGGYVVRNGTHYVTLPAMVDAAGDNAYAVVRLFPDRILVEGIGTTPSRTLSLH